MSIDNPAVDIPAGIAATSQPVAPPVQAGEAPESTPAPVDTTASEAKPEGETPDKQSRRESRAFATMRRENRELYRRLGAMEERLASHQPPPEGEQPNSRPAAAEVDHRGSAAARLAMERIEDTADDIEDIDGVIQKITANDFPGSVPMRDYLAGISERPAHLAQYLANNRQEAARISVLSEGMAKAALERIEAKLTAAPKPAPKKVTGAPPPVSTVGGGSNASFDPNKASMDDFAAWMRSRKA